MKGSSEFYSVLQSSFIALTSVLFLVDPVATIPVFPRHDGESRLQTPQANGVPSRSDVLHCSERIWARGRPDLPFGISLPSLQVAGGLILLLIGLDMVQARRSGTKEVRLSFNSSAKR